MCEPLNQSKSQHLTVKSLCSQSRKIKQQKEKAFASTSTVLRQNVLELPVINVRLCLQLDHQHVDLKFCCLNSDLFAPLRKIQMCFTLFSFETF